MSCSWTGLASIWRCYTVIVVWYFENGGATNSIQLLLSIRSDNTGLWRALFNFICISYMISRLADNSSRPSVPCDNCNAFMGCLKTFEKLLLQFWLTSQSFLKLKPQGFIIHSSIRCHNVGKMERDWATNPRWRACTLQQPFPFVHKWSQNWLLDCKGEMLEAN